MRNATEFWQGLRGMLKLYEKMLKRVCMAHDLAVTEADILGFLKNNPEKDTAADISELKMLSKGAVSKAVDSLIGKGLLSREPDKQDRRRIHLKITPEAAPVIEDITKVQNDYWNIMFEGFSEEEYRTYEKLRSRHFENVRRAEERRR
ncbi:MarR family transcriptional regulator [Mediterraneibacter glycyrrhizinilyticus]|nr:MarR family transcriptional regulator [Mediterraneibacter glycyrrhizinilyticus]MBM6854264.1 MarR family transcriptional regulator [Mediterraneibacter glycyrrhizinilyticus]